MYRSRLIEQANTARNHLEAVSMHVERMCGFRAVSLQDKSHNLSPILVGNNHKISLLLGRGGPCRILLEGIQGGIGSVIDLVDLIIHEGVNLGSIDNRECDVEKE